MSRSESRPYCVFVSYAREDAHRKNQFLAALKDQGIREVVAFFDDRQLSPGRPFAEQIDTFMCMADIILLLVTDNFLKSRYCMEVELPAARSLASDGERRLFQVRLSRPGVDDSALSDIPCWPDLSLPLDEIPEGKAAMAQFRLSLKRMIVEDLKVKVASPHDEHTLYWSHQLHGVPLRQPIRTAAYVAGATAFSIAAAAASLTLGLLPDRFSGPFTGLWLLGAIGAAAAVGACLARLTEMCLRERDQPTNEVGDRLFILGMTIQILLISFVGGLVMGAAVGFAVGLLMGLFGLAFDVGWSAGLILGGLFGALQGWNLAASSTRKHLRVFQELGELQAPPRPPERD